MRNKDRIGLSVSIFVGVFLGMWIMIHFGLIAMGPFEKEVEAKEVVPTESGSIGSPIVYGDCFETIGILFHGDYRDLYCSHRDEIYKITKVRIYQEGSNEFE